MTNYKKTNMIYLDNASTRKQNPTVTKMMLDMMENNFGNPSSLHNIGLKAEKTLEKSRKVLANSINANDSEIIFTSGGTESDNLAIFGTAKAMRKRGKRIITSQAEHPAVLESMKALKNEGFDVIFLPVDRHGLVKTNDLNAFVNNETILVSLMLVNNELGSILNLDEIKKTISSAENAIFHSDAVQAFGKIEINVEKGAINLLSLSGHKIAGPKGIGCLYVKKGTNISSVIKGGGQESNLRSGTENVPLIAGFMQAVLDFEENKYKWIDKMRKTREYLLQGLLDQVPDITINSPDICSPAILNVSFLGCNSEVMLHELETHGIYVSTGSACSSKKPKSHVLKACGLSDEVIESAIRFSFNEENDISEMDFVIDKIKKAAEKMRLLKRRR